MLRHVERSGRARCRPARLAASGGRRRAPDAREPIGSQTHGAEESPSDLARTAASNLATSIFPISIIAANARFATSPPRAIASVRTRGVICHDRPHLSRHQPHALSSPPLPTIAFQ